MEQPEYHPFHRNRVEKEYWRPYEVAGIGTTIFRRLGQGVLRTLQRWYSRR